MTLLVCPTAIRGTPSRTSRGDAGPASRTARRHRREASFASAAGEWSTRRIPTRLGGRGIAVRCDHANDAEVEALFARVRAEQGRLDLLVNNVTALPQRSELPAGARSLWDLHPFWEVPIAFWDAIHTVGLRSH
jgi:NAD(P)-dependent dehydrogenase (short-subunit alcohol dehydrogenase family)